MRKTSFFLEHLGLSFIGQNLIFIYMYRTEESKNTQQEARTGRSLLFSVCCCFLYLSMSLSGSLCILSINNRRSKEAGQRAGSCYRSHMVEPEEAQPEQEMMDGIEQAGMGQTEGGAHHSFLFSKRWWSLLCCCWHKVVCKLSWLQ